jgi:hypothetical protein
MRSRWDFFRGHHFILVGDQVVDDDGGVLLMLRG